MSKYLGDFTASTVIDFKFTTFRPSTGAPFTLAGSPVVSVYKDDDTAQSTAGVSLTVDFDSVTGLHHVRITTATDGTFYANGGEFECVITAGTVDSVSVVGSCIGRFTIGATVTNVWTADISAISISGQAGRYVTDTNVDTSNIYSSVTTIEGTPYKESVADTILGRNVGGGSNAGRLVKEALYALRNKSEIVGALLSVYDASDNLSWTAVVASSSSADPVTGIDP